MMRPARYVAEIPTLSIVAVSLTGSLIALVLLWPRVRTGLAGARLVAEVFFTASSVALRPARGCPAPADVVRNNVQLRLPRIAYAVQRDELHRLGLSYLVQSARLMINDSLHRQAAV
jgi:hypothetical protein